MAGELLRHRQVGAFVEEVADVVPAEVVGAGRRRVRSSSAFAASLAASAAKRLTLF